jgi:hypothetical protein
MVNISPKVHIDLHVEFRQGKNQPEALKLYISKRLLDTVGSRFCNRRAQIIDLEIELEHMLVQFGPLTEDVKIKRITSTDH